MELALRGRTALVTGASRGIGRAIALALAKEGAQIAAVATTETGAQPTAEACRALGVESEAYGVDVSNAASVTALVTKVGERFPKVDILVNNAGVTKDGVFLRMGEDDWDRVIDVNLKGAYLLTKGLARQLLKSPAGRVINMASVVGIQGNAGQANYAASKGGLVALTRSLSKEFGARGVCVNAVAPGFIDTDMTSAVPEAHRTAMLGAISLGRAGKSEEVADLVTFLASDRAAYITGQVLVVDGGLRM